MNDTKMREALDIQNSAINLLMSAVSSLLHGDGPDSEVIDIFDETARSFREFANSFRTHDTEEAS